MKAFSAIKPDVIWVRKIEKKGDDVFLVIRVRTDIKEIVIKGEEGSRVEWECDEVEIYYPVNPASVTIEDVKAFVTVKMKDTGAVEKEAVWKDVCGKCRELWGFK